MAITEFSLKGEKIEVKQEFWYLSFRLHDEFVDQYKDRKVNWGFPIGGGNFLGEIVFFDKYSRIKPDGTKERWHEVCRRVVEGYYSILKDHCSENVLYWDEDKAQRSARDAYERMFEFKWLPPGRGLWMMGTEFVHSEKNSAALQNCSFLSTEGMLSDPSKPFTRLMEQSMLGIGVGFDTLGANEHIEIRKGPGSLNYQIPDSREGWVESVKMILDHYLSGGADPTFDISLIRPAGSPIRGFGGVASGPGPLVRLHDSLRGQFEGRDGDYISSADIVDISNKIGVCVVAGNVRRSAEIAIGEVDDKSFLGLKDYDANPDRVDWGWASNNSVMGKSTDSYSHLVNHIKDNGEPGLLMIDLMQDYGRLADLKNGLDWRVKGTNPCAEQSLESHECCTLVETFPIKHIDLSDYTQTLKHAYLYGKAVTLMPTHWPDTNQIMQRNRRIGTSVTGQAEFIEKHGEDVLVRWLDEGYREIQKRDKSYSEWLCVRESIKTTSVKPSGSVSLVAGVSPGIHWPTDSIYIRRMRFSTSSNFLPYLADAGYKWEADVTDPENTIVVEFPTLGPQIRTEREVSLREKADLAAIHQKWWADNQVSVTLTFLPEEGDQIEGVIDEYKTKLKSISFLPILDMGSYPQMPYEAISRDQYDQDVRGLRGIDWDSVYLSTAHDDAGGEKFCNNDSCEI